MCILNKDTFETIIGGICSIKLAKKKFFFSYEKTQLTNRFLLLDGRGGVGTTARRVKQYNRICQIRLFLFFKYS